MANNDDDEGGPARPTSSHAFWDTQPVPRLDSSTESLSAQPGPIDSIKTVRDVRRAPYALPEPYEWYDMDLTDGAQLGQIYQLLTDNYVEDKEAMFRFDYSREFLAWALLPPGFRRDWHPAVRVKGTGKLVAFISAIPARMQVYDATAAMVEINFLCIHKKLRAKRLAPVLIREITRRVNLTDVWQAVYTAGTLLPRPVTRNRYYHRSLNPKKLIEVGFSHLSRRMTMKMTMKLYHLDDTLQLGALRPMTADDVDGVHALLSRYQASFSLYSHFERDDLAHWLVPRDGVVYSYVVFNEATREITDLISFYNLPSSILGHPKYTELKAAFSFYNVATSVPWELLMKDALVMAKREQFDVFNALDVMDNAKFFAELKFGIGDGFLHYYLYNWKCPEIKPDQNALVLM